MSDEVEVFYPAPADIEAHIKKVIGETLYNCYTNDPKAEAKQIVETISGVLQKLPQPLPFWDSSPFGVNIFVVPYLPTMMEKKVDRTWRERLFSLPWKPWVAEKTIMEECIYHDGKAFYMNQEVYDKLKKSGGVLVRSNGQIVGEVYGK